MCINSILIEFLAGHFIPASFTVQFRLCSVGCPRRLFGSMGRCLGAVLINGTITKGKPITWNDVALFKPTNRRRCAGSRCVSCEGSLCFPVLTRSWHVSWEKQSIAH